MADWYSSRCALTWKLKGTKYNRLLFQLVPKTHRTDGTEFGLLLKTPCSADAYTEGMSKKEQKFGNSGTLAQEIQSGFVYQRGMLPTPTTFDSTNASANMKSSQVKEGSMHSMTLTRMMDKGMLPTPRSRDWKGCEGRRGDIPSYIEDKLKITGKTSQLNPRFVAEMMGFPPNWTELPFQNGEQNQSKDMETL
jgi:hypothetical protein